MIRKATPEDIPQIIDMIINFLDEGKEFKGHGFDLAVAVNITRVRISSPGNILFVCEKEGILVGMISGYLTPYLLSRKLVVVEDMWYMEPDYRRGWDGMRLVKSFLDWSEENNAKAVSMSVTIGTDNEKAIKVLHRLGFKDIGICLLREF